MLVDIDGVTIEVYLSFGLFLFVNNSMVYLQYDWQGYQYNLFSFKAWSNLALVEQNKTI